MGSAESQCLYFHQQQQSHDWCNFQAFDANSIIAENVFMAVLIVILIASIKEFTKLQHYRRRRKYKQLFGDVYLHVYILIFTWLFCSLVKTIINITVYYSIMEPFSQQVVPAPSSPIVVLSVAFQFLDYCCPFLILYLMILIPYKWFEQFLLNIEQKKDIQLVHRKKIHQYFIILKIIKFYLMWVRPWFIGLLISQPFLFYFSGIKFWCNNSFINSSLIYIDALITLFVYIFGYFVGTFLHQNSLIFLQKSDVRRIKCQFRILLAVIITRIFFNFYFKILGGQPVVLNSTCSGENPDQKQSLSASLIYLCIANFIMHILPIAVVLYIYRPSIKHRKNSQQMHINKSWSQDYDSVVSKEDMKSFSPATSDYKSSRSLENTSIIEDDLLEKNSTIY